MFDDVLIESLGLDKRKGAWTIAVIAGVVHLIIIRVIIVAGAYLKENPEVIEKPIGAFIVASAPPPPPPPPPAGNAGQTPPRTPQTPREQPREQLRQPREVRETPEIERPRDDGATAGGVVGGQKGGKVGGVVGGEIGGETGGQLGGKIGGQIGGTGDVPVRVGGNVKAPIAVLRVDPVYTEVARKARVHGIVIIEAVIDRQGNVTEARVLKPLGMGLDQAALTAIKRWKFQPGTLNGQPVPVYYNLTVNFRIE